MSPFERKPEDFVVEKLPRPCDICMRSSARWYCPADDAFLCQTCDLTVHSANYVARRHERLRLRVSSTFKKESDEPTWHNGFRRKARTPRGGPKGSRTDTVVPEMETGSEEEGSAGGEEEQLLFRVPVLLSELSPPEEESDVKTAAVEEAVFLQGELDMGEFEIDVESLLGRGLDDEAFSMEALVLMGSPVEGGSEAGCSLGERVKEEKEDEGEMYCEGLVDVNFGCGSPWMEEEKSGGAVEEGKKRSIALRLDYKKVIAEWAMQGSPWTNGERPQLDSGDGLMDCMGLTLIQGDMHSGASNGGSGSRSSSTGTGGRDDGGREAKVSRYREKRRTRLFSKKIRYEVRKLNAEKRPRMKGRFVKRTTLAAVRNAAVAPPSEVKRHMKS